jgi:hypothetical protein
MAGRPCTSRGPNAVAAVHRGAVEIDGWESACVLGYDSAATAYCPACGCVRLRAGRLWMRMAWPSAAQIVKLAAAITSPTDEGA